MLFRSYGEELIFVRDKYNRLTEEEGELKKGQEIIYLDKVYKIIRTPIKIGMEVLVKVSPEIKI